MIAGLAIVGAIAAERLTELAIARRNTSRLMARGAVEVGRGHYPLFVLLHGAWLASVAAVAAAGAAIHLIPLVVSGLLMLARLWVMTSLGPYWTTRIVTLPGIPLVESGPYRLCRHPNYCVVAGEILTLPLVFGAWRLALGFSLANALLTFHRIHVEGAALEERRHIAVTARGRIGEAG